MISLINLIKNSDNLVIFNIKFWKFIAVQSIKLTKKKVW